MEVTDIAEKILELSDELGLAKKAIKARATEKASAKATYDKVLALTLLRLKNGDITEFEGNTVGSIAVTVMESIAKGMCWKERLEMEKTEALYKSAITYVEVTTTQLQGYQSIYKHLDAG